MSLDGGDPAGERASLVVLPESEYERLPETAAELGLDVSAAVPEHRAVGRPVVRVDGDQVSMRVFGCTPDAHPVAVRLLACPHSLLVQVPDDMVADTRTTLDGSDNPAIGVGDVLLMLALRWEDALEGLVTQAEELDASAGLRLAASRRQIALLRSRLFAIRHQLETQARILDPGEELTDALPPAAVADMRRARVAFDSGSRTATRTYALLGDTLSLQSATISERLTLISTVFLPLTVTTGFFGMNFGWLTDHVMSAKAFWLLGVLLPVIIVIITVTAVRRFGMGG